MKLTTEQKEEIIKLKKEGTSYKELSKLFSLSKSTLYLICYPDAKEKAKFRDRNRKNKEERRAYTREWRKQNTTAFRLVQKKWYENNREKMLNYLRDYKKTHRAYFNAQNKSRETIKKRGSKMILTSFQKTQIENFYILARALTVATKEAYHVDHIYPLKGKTSCGLHIPSNLQVLKGIDNIKKGNKINA